MFEPLSRIVKLLIEGIDALRKHKDRKDRTEAITQILEVYFLLKDCVDDAEKLLSECEWDPVGKIKSLPSEEAEKTVKQWDLIVRRQGLRLYLLQGHIYADHRLSIIDPELQKELTEVIGNKMNRAVTLHGIGSALYFYVAFPTAETPVEKARYIQTMVGAEDKGPLNMEQIISEIEKLRTALDGYRSVVSQLVSNEELVAISNIARERALTAVRA